MKHKESRKIIWIIAVILCFNLFSSSYNKQINSTNDSIDNAHDISRISYDAHNPILITSNEDFIIQGFSGDGTANDPFLIEGFDIQSDETCINITNTDAYFKIRYCFLRTVTRTQGYGIYLNNSVHGTIESCLIEKKFNGIFVEASTCSLIHSLIWECSRNGIYLNTSRNCIIMNNTIYENFHNGIYAYNSWNYTINNNQIVRNYWRGVHIYNSNNYKLLSNNITDNLGIGVHIHISENGTVNSCDLSRNSHGAYFYSVQNLNFTQNLLMMNNENGINFQALTYNCKIIDNEVIQNNQSGIRIHSSNSDNTIYGNYISLNAEGNAIDDGTNNTWDNNIDMGNIWSNYDGQGPYNITGLAGSVDRYPIAIIAISRPIDFQVEYRSQNTSITWNVSAINPDKYMIYIDNIRIDFKDWNGLDITVAIDTSSLGVFNFTLFLNSTDGYWTSDSVFIIVTDSIAPIIDHPIDIEYLEGIVGNYIIWNPYDFNPFSHEVIRNGLRLRYSGWNGSNIKISIDNLSPGIYEFTLIVSDICGNSVSDTVIVTVTPYYSTSTITTNTGSTTNQEIPNIWFSPVLGSLLFFGGAFILLIAVLIMKGYIIVETKDIDAS